MSYIPDRINKTKNMYDPKAISKQSGMRIFVFEENVKMEKEGVSPDINEWINSGEKDFRMHL